MRRMMLSMKFWTAVAGALGAIAAALGLPPEKATAVVASITALAAVVIAATGYEDGKADPPTPPQPA